MDYGREILRKKHEELAALIKDLRLLIEQQSAGQERTRANLAASERKAADIHAALERLNSPTFADHREC